MDEGIVQEEIRFTICTEMLVSVLLCEVMLTNECVFLIGCEQFTSYTGYADTFQAKADFNDSTPKWVTNRFIIPKKVDLYFVILKR